MDYDKLKNRVLKHNINGKYKFIDRRKNYKKLCLLLIGYKQFLWNDVLDRFLKYLPGDVDVCLISSGKFIDEVSSLASRYNWSYLSTKKNNVCLIQNIAISLFPHAELIYKMDEDIFLTEGAFEKLEHAMKMADEESPYISGLCAPILNVNAYGYYRILERLNKLDEYKKHFGQPKMISGQKSPIESDAEIAKYMWGVSGDIPQIDELNRMFSSQCEYSICPIRLSIGFILFKRQFWESFWRFPVVLGNGMGLDETIMIGASAAFSHAIVVAENCVVGHFGYGPQGAEMKKLYKERRDLFCL